MAGLASNAFISYHRPDNVDYLDVVDHLRSDLGGRFAASTGRSLEIFLDRASIGWGADWRGAIREGLEKASFFIPVITMRFFQSETCREEFTTFYENAHELGVTDLIMPVVLAGGSHIRADHPERLVRLVESLNYVSIEDAWEAGYGSPEWARIINHMVREVERNLGDAETALSALEVEPTGRPDGTPIDHTDAAEQDEAADLEALTTDLTEASASLTLSFEAIGTLGGAIQRATQEGQRSSSPTGKRAALQRRIGEIRAAAEAFETAASDVEAVVTRTDARLRAVVKELRSIGTPIADGQLEVLFGSLRDFPDLTGHIASIEEAGSGLRVASLTNVSLRQALTPALRGLNSMSAGFATAQSWSALPQH